MSRLSLLNSILGAQRLWSTMSEDMEFNLGWLVQAEAVAKGSGLWTVVRVSRGRFAWPWEIVGGACVLHGAL